MLSKIFFEENKFLLGIFILITFSFLYSLNIYLFVYDGHHHGLVFSNAIDLLEGRKPYSEIWIQYGFLTTLIHSIVILIFGKQLLFLNIFTIIIYLTSIFFISLTVRKLTNNCSKRWSIRSSWGKLSFISTSIFGLWRSKRTWIRKSYGNSWFWCN